MSAVTAGCCSVEPGACASPAPSAESWLWPRALGSCELHPSRETARSADPEDSSNPAAPGAAVTPMTSLASQLNAEIQMWQHAAVSLLL